MKREEGSPPAHLDCPGEEPPRAFVPAQPRSVADSKRIESLRFYTAARALEDLRRFPEAIRLLEKALAADPDSIPVLRRLSRINFALGREAEAIAYCQRVIANDPGDIETVGLLVEQYRDDPSLPPRRSSRMRSRIPSSTRPRPERFISNSSWVPFMKGRLRFDLAAACFAKVIDALDEKSNARLAPSELRRFLGADEGQAYLRFGRVFLQAKQYDQAIRAFRRGLVL